MENSSLKYTGGNQNKEISVNEYIKEKSHKNSFKLVLYANASGTHKLMPLVINRALKDYKNKLPVTFKSQTRLNSMTVLRYREDLENFNFKPSVRAHQAKKVILLLNVCLEHKISTEILDCENFKVIYLPPNTNVEYSHTTHEPKYNSQAKNTLSP